ncbi:LuxR C-terminal-related transcriptional regulator [Nakamurella alba]|uniref:LuxR C-terminal-related transcriptional regulator n=1 Tax=Nakamurella alba TaxID=2665158 RepID=UPI002AC31EB1|nr:LuxR C-terminal-related transcriptional regulator [Nakamurella alba]
MGEVLPAVRERIRGRRGAVVLIGGAPGIGKSTTMDRLVRDLATEMAFVSRVSADETSRRQPFGVISSLVGLKAEYPPRPGAADRILETIENLCAAGPVALCADDVHQADADSLRVLGQLVGSARDLPLVLLLTRRHFPVREGLDALAADPEVITVEVTGLDAAGVAAAVRERCDAEPSPELLHALRAAGGNPFHLQSLLSDLMRHDRIEARGGRADLIVSGPTTAALPSVQESVRAQLVELSAETRSLLEILAVWGRPAPLAVLGTLSDLGAQELRALVRPAIDLEILQVTPDEELTFTHDLYRDVLYADLLPGLRRMLHAACAAELRSSGGIATEIVQHVGDSLADGVLIAEALRTARTDLQHAPLQAADLLAQVHTRSGSPEADEVAIARAGALAAAGRMAEVITVVRAALAVTRDAGAHTLLTRLLLHSMVDAARTDETLVIIDEELAHLVGEQDRHPLVHLRRWSLVLAGRGELSGGRTSGDGTSGAALVPSSMELFLQARCRSALETVRRAQKARETAGTHGWSDGATAPTWPAWYALYAEGPEAAGQLSVQARRNAQRTGRGWLFPQHLLVAGTIDHFAGRWDDALTVLQAQWDIATESGSGWRSRGLGLQLQIQVFRGALDEVAAGVRHWYSTGHPDQFGLPWVPLAEVLLAEARGDLAEVRRLTPRVWSGPLDSGRLLWALLAGPDLARLALRSGDDGLLQRIRREIGSVPLDEVPVLAAVPGLVTAISEADPEAARIAAGALGASGSAIGEMQGWEEAAVAAAAAGDRDAARTYADRCRHHSSALGAVTVDRRLASRLRDHGVRLGATGARGRPATGLASLTPTESLVAQRVSQGLTSPQIADQLYVSPRTVQTHVSNILRKLDLRSRVELAALFARRADAGLD